MWCMLMMLFNEWYVLNCNLMIYLCNVDFNLFGDIGFYVEDFDVEFVLRWFGELVDFDDLN